VHQIPPEKAKAEIQQRYDRFASTETHGGEHIGPARAYFRGRKLALATELAPAAPGASALEIGCARGQFTLPLARRGYHVVGYDLSPASVELARHRAAEAGVTNVEFVAGDAENLGAFPDDRFDAVFSFSTLRYVPDVSRALGEIRRVLKPGGRAVLDFPNRLCPWFYVKQWLGSERHPYDHWYAESDLRRLFAGARLDVRAARTLLFTPTIAPDRLVPLFRAMDWVGERAPVMRNFAGIIMVMATKA
jgi:ubiquinone/menaquinone biosynthesis C-methylase UbiE